MMANIKCGFEVANNINSVELYWGVNTFDNNNCIIKYLAITQCVYYGKMYIFLETVYIFCFNMIV